MANNDKTWKIVNNISKSREKSGVSAGNCLCHQGKVGVEILKDANVQTVL